MSVLNQIKKPIQNELDIFERKFFESIKSNISLLNLIIRYYLKRKGKQLRPIFVFLAAQLAGTISQSTYSAAVLVELMHTATLIHDDVVDDSHKRRGFFTINALWKNKIAVLIGDFFLAKGLLHAIQAKEFKLLEIMSDAVKEMSEGELLQIEKARKLDITKDTYFDIIRKKTATLLSAAISSGLSSAKSNDEEIKTGYRLGEYIGIAFQIRDDLLDYESSSVIGKPAGNDIRERKMTLPLIYTLEQCNATEKRELLSLIKRKNKSQKQIDSIVEKVKSSGGIEYTKSIMIEFKKKADAELAKFNDCEAKRSFEMLFNYIIDRKK